MLELSNLALHYCLKTVLKLISIRTNSTENNSVRN